MRKPENRCLLIERIRHIAGSRPPYYAVSEQHSRRCGVTTAGQPSPLWAVVAQGESPYAWISASCSWHSGPMTRLQARWIATAVPCRPREAQSRLWSHKGGANDATVKTRRSWGVTLRMHIAVRSRIVGLFGAKTLLVSSSNNARPTTHLYYR